MHWPCTGPKEQKLSRSLSSLLSLPPRLFLCRSETRVLVYRRIRGLRARHHLRIKPKCLQAGLHARLSPTTGPLPCREALLDGGHKHPPRRHGHERTRWGLPSPRGRMPVTLGQLRYGVLSYIVQTKLSVPQSLGRHPARGPVRRRAVDEEKGREDKQALISALSAKPPYEHPHRDCLATVCVWLGTSSARSTCSPPRQRRA